MRWSITEARIVVTARRTLRRQTESKRYGEAQMERKWRAEEYTGDRGPEAKRPETERTKDKDQRQ